MSERKPEGRLAAVGVVWYKPENYQRCLALYADADELPETYEEWLATALEHETWIEEEGMNVVRIDTTPEKPR